MPELARRLPLPRRFWDDGIRRYGFHGLSYEYVVVALGDAVRGRVVIKHLGALAAVLGGLDCLVFTGGIGEHAAPVRAEICVDLGHLGIRLDADANSRHADVISARGSACTV